jgi:hypothetical protein
VTASFSRIPTQTGMGFRLYRGDLLTVVDPEGEQVSDLFCVAADDCDEWLSSGRSIDYGGTVAFTKGSVLWSNRSRPMLTIVEDTCGRHDFLLTPCSQETFDLLYPELEGEAHPSCFGNLVAALAPFGVEPSRIATTFNIFMNAWTEPTGELHIDRPRTEPGDRIVFRAELDLIVGLTACSAEKSNGGRCKPIDFSISRNIRT